MHQPAAASVDPQLASRLHARANAARWSLGVEAFAAALEVSVQQAFAGRQPPTAEVERYLSALHLEDLAIACACAAGDEVAWEHFIREHRPALYRAAEAIDRTGGGRELADSLYGDLFGLRAQGGERRSLFHYFHGRSSLSTWVRAVLAQRHVDRIRQQRRLVPLSEEAPVEDRRASDPAAVSDVSRFRAVIAAAFSAAIAALAPRDRLRLTLYYVRNMKLAAIGRMLGEHEATVSRHLTRVRGEIRVAIERHLRENEGFDRSAVAECFSAVADDAGDLDLVGMIDASEGGKKVPSDRSEDRRERG